MFSRSPLCRLFLCVSLTSSLLAVAQEETPTDIEGSKDHPAVKRYPGSTIVAYDEKEFETMVFPVTEPAENFPGKVKNPEGKYYRAEYQLPAKASCTQVLRNFENAFKAAGLTVHTGKENPEGFDQSAAGWVSAEGKVKGKGGTVYLTQGCNNDPGVHTGVLMVIEEQAMAQKVEIDAGAMAAEIESSGHIALYGINFATGKAEIAPESAKVLAEIAQLLGSKPEWKLRVEGHTDNVGKPAANMKLSKDRAAAVKDYLVKKHAIAAARLTAEGYGDSKPVAPNTTDDGKAKNRRVELSKL
jgi:OmpA-OmpF porin, OOP family